MTSFKEPTRREFLAVGSAAALAAAATAVGAQTSATDNSAIESSPFALDDLLQAAPQRTFSGENATQVAMPLGGIGAGSVCLNGYGGLQDFSIRTRPETTALPAGFSSNSPEAAFAVLHIKGDPSVTKLIEGPFPAFKIFDQGLQGQGLRRGGFEGFPRFGKCAFKGEYPFGEAELSDSSVPLEVTLLGWNPFIPLDDKNSGIPCLILEYTLRNTSAQPVEYEFSYHLSHLAPGCKPDQSATINTVIPGKGVFLHNSEEPNAEALGSASLTAIGGNPHIKGMWLRSPGWEFDCLSALWREVSTGTFTANEGSNSVDTAGRNGASILLAGRLAPSESRTYPILITWHFPNCYIQDGGKAPAHQIQGAAGCRTIAGGLEPLWRPYYVKHWKDARDVAFYVEREYASLRDRTLKFKEAFFSSTLPPYVLDAVSANLGILKSPTVLREENGNLWGWEGCFPDNGCCHGSCTHVWNYAQAFPHLYPQLERTLRDLELVRSMDERGHVNFRGAIPDGPVDHSDYAAADGQLGGIMKVYRDWQISGDSDWLGRMYPLAKRSLDYCTRTWDPDHRGALFEPHHNTYDIEFWGADGMCTSIYLGALSAMAQMARATGHSADEEFYADLAKRSAALMDGHLFNGEYYQQKVQYLGLHDTSFAGSVADVDDKSSEMQHLLKREGPKYQYGSGCLSDGVIGAWMARTYGIETPLDRNNVRSTLHAIFKHNFKTDLSEHANAQRPGYAMGREPGLLLCSWPRGDKPTLPFVYSDEVWTGIEYHVASHLIMEGFVTEGLTIVKALRSRYDGKTRNPWNEYECGNYYARAMSSYALLSALSGFRYSAVQKTVWFGPRLNIRPFRSFFSTAFAFGTAELDAASLRMRVIEGELPIEKLVLTGGTGEKTLDWRVTIRPGTTAVKPLNVEDPSGHAM
ncbi:MAG: GH116 family glycosyl hydrolase [Terracidiphilus sp.]